MAAPFSFSGGISNFQTSTASSAPFGGFNTTSAPGLRFGNATTTTTTLSFGTPATTTTPSLFGNFGAPATTTTPSLFGNFGGPTTTAAPSLFSGFGATTTTTPSLFGGFNAATTAAPSMFGPFGATTTTTPSLFGGFNSTFSTGNAPSLFSGATAGFGAKAPNAQLSLPGIGGAVQKPPGMPDYAAQITGALSFPNVYGDERDAILAKWNQLQAFWGTGKGYYCNVANVPPVDFTLENPFCHFKAVGYSCLPTMKPEEGLVGLLFNKKSTDVANEQQQLVDALHRIFGSRPTLSVCVEGIKVVAGENTEVVIYIIERAPTGASRILPCHEVHAYLEQAMVKSQLGTLGVVNILSKTAPTKEQLKLYLDNPPAGIDSLLWQQAKLDNPDPSRLIPVPMMGFQELQKRLVAQEEESKQHNERLRIIGKDIHSLEDKLATTVAKITEFKRKQIELSHRVLKLTVKQEISRKMGYAIQGDEEQIRVRLESIQMELNAPGQFKTKISEMLPRLQFNGEYNLASSSNDSYTLDGHAQAEIMQFLKNESVGISHLMSIIKNDMEDLKIIKAGLEELNTRRR